MCVYVCVCVCVCVKAESSYNYLLGERIEKFFRTHFRVHNIDKLRSARMQEAFEESVVCRRRRRTHSLALWESLPNTYIYIIMCVYV